LKPAEVEVELYWGYLTSVGEIRRPGRIEMHANGEGDGVVTYTAKFECQRTGRLGYSARVIPKHAELVDPLRTGFVKWAEG
jgi:starch phosphorylase